MSTPIEMVRANTYYYSVHEKILRVKILANVMANSMEDLLAALQ